VGLPLAGARPVAQVAPADTQVPAVRLPLLAARQRHQPREVVPVHSAACLLILMKVILNLVAEQLAGSAACV
jgi:hypothetical protein